MKYHSTKKSVLTITIIIVLLLLISAIGIFRFQARTPVQAVSQAIFSNLEMPDNYKIEIKNINESFLLGQKIEEINLLKDDQAIISISNLEVNQNLFNYLSYILFNKKLDLVLSADNIDVNITGDISDLASALSNIRIKDNTIAIQSRLEKEVTDDKKVNVDYSDLLDKIITQEYLDLSPIINSKILLNDYQIKIKNGNIFYNLNNMKISSKISDFEFSLNDNGILNNFNLNFNNLNVDNNDLGLVSASAQLKYSDKLVDFNFDNLDVNYLINDIKIDKLKASYNLEKVGEVLLDASAFNFNSNNLNVSLDSFKSQVKTNFNDFSIIMAINESSLNLNNDSIQFKTANLGLSSVNDKLSFYLNNEGLLSLDISNQLINISDIDLSLFSSNLFFDKSNIKVSNIDYQNGELISKFSNIDASINSEVDSQILSTNDKLDLNKLTISNLTKYFTNLSISLTTDLNLNNLNHNISSSLYSVIDLEDSFKTATASFVSNNIQLDNLQNLVSADINFQGPIKIQEGNIQNIEANINYSDSLYIKSVGSLNGSLSNNNINTTLLFDDFNINNVSSILFSMAPPIKNYLNENSMLKGSISYDGNIPISNTTIKGNTNSSLLVKNAVFLDNEYNLGINFNTDIDDKDLSLNQLSVSLFNYRLAFNGTYFIDTKALNGDLNFENIDNGDKLFGVTFDNNNLNNSTNFNLSIPALSDFSITGEFKNQGNSIYSVASLFNLKSESIDLNLLGDLNNLVFNANSSKGLLFDLNVEDAINIDLNFNDFTLIDLDNSTFNGNLIFNYKNPDDWLLTVNDLDFSYNLNQYELIGNGSITQNLINLDRVDYYNNTYNTKFYGSVNYTGPKYYDLVRNRFSEQYNLSFTFGDRINQRIEASLLNEGDLTNILLDITDFDISRLFNVDKEILLDSRIVGTTDFNSNNNIKGSINFNESGTLVNNVEQPSNTEASQNLLTLTTNSLFDRIVSFIPFINLPSSSSTINLNQITSSKIQNNTKISFSTDLSIINNNYLLENLDLVFPTFSIHDASFDLNMEDFNLLLSSNIYYIKPSRNTDLESSMKFGFYLDFSSFVQSLQDQFSINQVNFNTLETIYQRRVNQEGLDLSIFNNINGYIKISDINMFEDTNDFEKLWTDKVDEKLLLSNVDSTFNIIDGKVELSSGNINGNIDLINKVGEINIDPSFGLGGNFLFDYNNTFDVYISDIHFPVSILEKLIYINIIKLYGEDFTGELLVKDLFNDSKYYGELTSRDFRVKTMYTKNNEISAPNISIVFYEDKLYSNNFRGNFYDKINNKVINFTASSEIDLPNFNFDSFSIELNIPDYVPITIPIRGMNFTVDTYAKDNFKYVSQNNTSFISGDLTLKDSIISSGVTLPSWYESRSESNGDIKLHTADNNVFYYPHIDNPILSVTMANNQNVELQFDSLTRSYSVLGDINIEQGELFYFQKNFYINSGSLSFEQDQETRRLIPYVTLNATLKELDANAQAVDIILNLNNSTLDNINPVFSSSPAKTQQEIMSILGQAFASDSQSNTNSVASIASAATSVFSSLGYLETGGVSTLNRTIASTLNLDFFSLKSNIVENIILDTFIEDPRYSSFTPLARYLNNTTIYMGKYLTPNSKLQILINLLAKNEDVTTSFITQDLSLDLEMSFDVDTELAQFSFFTNPSELSILKILDSIGFSVTKTIHLR